MVTKLNKKDMYGRPTNLLTNEEKRIRITLGVVLLTLTDVITCEVDTSRANHRKHHIICLRKFQIQMAWLCSVGQQNAKQNWSSLTHITLYYTLIDSITDPQCCLYNNHSINYNDEISTTLKRKLHREHIVKAGLGVKFVFHH